MGNIAILIRDHYCSDNNKGALARAYVQEVSSESQLLTARMFKGVKLNKRNKRNMLIFFHDLNGDVRYPIVLSIIQDQPEENRQMLFSWIDSDKKLKEYMEDDIWINFDSAVDISLDNLQIIKPLKINSADIFKIKKDIREMQEKLNNLLKLLS